MSRRWYSRLLFVIVFFITTIVLNSMLESININRNERQKSNEERIDEHLNSLEDSIRELNKAIKVKQRQNEQHVVKFLRRNITRQLTEKKSSSNQPKSECDWRRSSPMNTTFDVQQLYETLPFDNPHGGIWVQGFDIQYNTSQWTPTNKLKIIVMPHSHCDPGWLNTYETYFFYATRYIIDTMIKTLDKNPQYRFIWAEMSFLSLWWDRAKPQQRELLKKVIHNRQFEIVTGGWVMNDEANTHYFAMLDQLIEGHQFIANKFGENVTLKSSWANDPFGYSPTMAYLLQRSGIEYIAIQRVHYHIKKALAKEKNLEFLWQQPWDRTTSTRIFTHVLPFYGYDIPHTCGPDPKVCCQFDFKRSANVPPTCSWGINPVRITDENVHERAELLLDQYRKKSQLYRSNTLLIPLGDDFRYRAMYETKNQLESFDRLLNYINQRTDWNVQIQYGTLTDYFEELFREKSREDFPSYTGDFFTYADREDHYWSGYYTSRAFFKRMDRVVESYLRATEILFSFAHIKNLEGNIVSFFPKNDFFGMLITARRNLGIFQHHDGITGTAREHVVQDYGQKLLDVIRISEIIMQQSAVYLLFQNDYPYYNRFFILNEEYPTFQSLPQRRLLSFNYPKQSIRNVYIYNPTDQRRIEIITILLDRYQVQVTSHEQSTIPCQIDPKWSDKRSNIIDQNQFELLILVDIKPYSIKEYTIQLATIEDSCPLTKIEYVDQKQIPRNPSIPFHLSLIDPKQMEISNRFLSVLFSKSGAILNVQHKHLDENIRFHTNLISYGTSKQPDRHSGAYLFIPNGNAQDIPISNHELIRIQRGPLIHRVDIIHQLVVLRYELTNSNGSNDHILKLSAITHLNMDKDTELALRFSTGIKNGAEFFTDLNGFQMVRRKTYEKLPIQGNVYPMPTMAYIEDDYTRFTILASQPSGVTCLKSGVIDVFLDRRLTLDDGRGLGQGVMDNLEIISTFELLFESRHTIADRTSLTGYPTLLAHQLSIELLYPIHLFHLLFANRSLDELNLFSKPSIFPKDYHLVNLRTLNNDQSDLKYYPSKYLAFILRRFAYDCNDRASLSEPPTFEDFFSTNQIDTIEQTSLSLRHIKQKLNLSSKLDIPLAEIVTYKIGFSTSN